MFLSPGSADDAAPQRSRILVKAGAALAAALLTLGLKVTAPQKASAAQAAAGGHLGVAKHAGPLAEAAARGDELAKSLLQ